MPNPSKPTVACGSFVQQGDALRSLCELPTASVDAIVTDPPYASGGYTESAKQAAKGQGHFSETLRRDGWFDGDNMGTGGLVWLLRSIGFEATRLLRDHGSLVVFCDWRMLPVLSPAIESSGLRYRGLIVWDKGVPGLGNGFRPRHELAMHFCKGRPKFHAKNVGNVIAAKKVSPLKRDHKCEKPVELLTEIIRVVSPEGGTIVDPFMGSGATGQAALQLGRHFVGFDRDPQYVEIASQRLGFTSGKAAA